jgi:hypothetical protein
LINYFDESEKSLFENGKTKSKDCKPSGCKRRLEKSAPVKNVALKITLPLVKQRTMKMPNGFSMIMTITERLAPRMLYLASAKSPVRYLKSLGSGHRSIKTTRKKA